MIKKMAVVFCLIVNSPAVLADVSVFACEPEWAALTKILGGEKVNVFSATTSMQDPHHIQARPSLIAKARRADLLVCTGAELEVGWLPILLRKSANPRIQPGQPGYFMSTSHVPLLEKPASIDRSMGDVHAAGNPHIQFDPRRILTVAAALKDTLLQIDGTNAEIYRNSYLQFEQEWNAAIKQWKHKAAALYGKPVVVQHRSWIYLEQWLGLKRVAVLEPKPGVPPSSSYLAGVLTQLKQQPADVIIRSGYEDERPAQWLSERSGIPVITIPFSVEDYQQPDSLKHWMDEVIDKLVALQ